MKSYLIFSIAVLLSLSLVACDQTVQAPDSVTPLIGFVTVTPALSPTPRPSPTPVPQEMPRGRDVSEESGISSDPSFYSVRFTDVAKEVGLDFQHGAFRWEVSGDPVAMMGGGLCWLDFDRDGWLDLFVVNSYAVAEAGSWEAVGGLPRSALFRNFQGHFTDVGSASGVDLALRGNGCVAADLDLDGWTDLYITTSRVNVLLWNNGDGTFTEGAQAAGVDAYGWQSSAVVGDLNSDGWPDIFVAGYVDINNRIPEATLGFPNTYFGRRDLLFINEGLNPSGRVSFREMGVAVGLEKSDFEYGLGALLTDLDSDGDLDLYIANDTNPNRLYENVAWSGGKETDPEGIGFRFEELGGPANVGDGNSGMGIAGGDYDSDGRFDLFVTNLGQQLHSVYLNQSTEERLSFRDATDQFGITDLGVGWTGWGTAWADVDLDTDLDLVIVNGNVPVTDPPADAQVTQVFGNLTAQGLPGQFEELTGVAGLNEVGPLLGRGSAMADFDNDGDLDIAISSIGGRLTLLQNSGRAGNWLEVQLEGFYPGTIVTAVLPDGRELWREIHAGSSYLSSEDPRVHFGLGAAEEVADLRIRWPNGEETRLGSIAANQLFVVQPEIHATAGLSCQGEFPERPVYTEHIEQEAIVADQLNFEDLLKIGETLFTAKFNICDGQGRPATTGAGDKRRADEPHFTRISSPDSNSCAGCHNDPFTGGAGDFVANVFVLAQALDPVAESIAGEFSNNRNTLGMHGAGPIEMLAREMTADLHAIRDKAMADAAELNQRITLSLDAKGVNFGTIVAYPDGSIDTSKVKGVDDDLIIKPFHQAGVVVSLREFTVNAMNHHHGMQAEERFDLNPDKGADFDGDGIERELTIGDITAVTLWQASLMTPGRLLPADPGELAQVEQGEILFDEIGCTTCHVPEMQLEKREFVEPNPFNPAGTWHDTIQSISFDMTTTGIGQRLEPDDEGGAIVRAYTDLKRHNLCDAEDEPDAIRYFCNEQLSQSRPDQDGRPGSEFFITRKLWDVGNTAPYGHVGDLTTITEAILVHGGEARAQRDAFVGLSYEDQAAVVRFLQTLQVLPEGDELVITAGEETATVNLLRNGLWDWLMFIAGVAATLAVVAIVALWWLRRQASSRL